MIKIAIIGTGGMANFHAEQFSKQRDVRLTAACDVDADRVREFAARHKIPKAFTSLDKLFAEGDFEAVSNVTPDRWHAPITLQALRHGRHVLCEKPLAVCYADAAKMARAAKKAGVIHMVNFSYRNNSCIHKAHELVHSGVLGRILHVDAAYYQSWLNQNAWGDWHDSQTWLWRLSTAHGSRGTLGDIGVHLLDFASYPVGKIESVNCTLRTFPKAPGDRIGNYTLDANDSVVVTASFQNGALGSLRATRIATGHDNSITLALFGDEGSIKIDLDRSGQQLEWCRIKNRVAGPWATLDCGSTPSIYERFVKSIRTGVNDQPDFARGAEIQKALDACEQSHIEGRTIRILG
ncbi:MAG: Gfo/Idh/MocA family oxidoreductase [Verrucomicrobiota bacterium]